MSRLDVCKEADARIMDGSVCHPADCFTMIAAIRAVPGRERTHESTVFNEPRVSADCLELPVRSKPTDEHTITLPPLVCGLCHQAKGHAWLHYSVGSTSRMICPSAVFSDTHPRASPSRHLTIPVEIILRASTTSTSSSSTANAFRGRC